MPYAFYYSMPVINQKVVALLLQGRASDTRHIGCNILILIEQP